MKKVTLNIPDNKYVFFMELVKQLGFKIVKPTSKPKKAPSEDAEDERILEGIRQAVEEVNLIKAGKLEAVPLKDFLDEL